ncbi:MAG: hypothetical protein SFY92_02790 [Verrucomicrobiae bacterium]|nr:hypothetical protein [Verrucomicrobiae bacterium]
MSLKGYQSYKGLPFVAGIAKFEHAMSPGMSVEECVLRLKRFHYTLKRVHEIMTARITAEPIYEIKTAFSLHAYLASEHVSAIRKRISEMREPPLGLDVVPDAALEVLFDEILCAPSTQELIWGLYGVVLPALKESMEKYMAETSPLADHPSYRLCKIALLEINEINDYGTQAVGSLVDAEARGRMKHFAEVLETNLVAAGGIDGTGEKSDRKSERFYSVKPYEYQRVPKRDERWKDSYNQGVNAEVFLYDPKYPAQVKTLMMFFKRIREIDVPEMMASIITETKGKPWGYYNDMSRQLWDEARHSMMGEVGFVNLGIDWTKIPVNMTWALGLNTQLKPMERHAVLYFIEQGLMPKTGKRHEWEVAMASGNGLSRLFQDFDWADEVLHARIGRDWYVSDFKDATEAIEYGDKCWSRVLLDWNQWKKEGLTEHRNWWPEIYTEACRIWGLQPDPEILAYDTTYEKVRPDLKNIAVSG